VEADRGGGSFVADPAAAVCHRGGSVFCPVHNRAFDAALVYVDESGDVAVATVCTVECGVIAGVAELSVCI